MVTVSEIIKAAGGARAISEKSDGAIQKDAVYKWPTIGVPDRHWPLLIELTGASPEQLYQANLKARSSTAEAAE